MVIPATVRPAHDPPKAVDAQLPLEAAQPTPLKVLRHDFFRELFRLVNTNRAAVRVEGNNVLLPVALNFAEDAVQLFGEGFRMTAAVIGEGDAAAKGRGCYPWVGYERGIDVRGFVPAAFEAGGTEILECRYSLRAGAVAVTVVLLLFLFVFLFVLLLLLLLLLSVVVIVLVRC